MSVFKLPLSVDRELPFHLLGSDGMVAFEIDVEEEPCPPRCADIPDHDCYPNTRALATAIAHALNVQGGF